MSARRILQLLGIMASRREWEHLTVVTSEFHAARVKLLFRQCFDADEVAIIGVPAQQSSYRWIVSRVRERDAIIAAATFARAC